MEITIYIITALLCGLIGGTNRIGFLNALFYAFVLTPIIGFAVVLASPSRMYSEWGVRRESSSDYKLSD